jgi:hydrogenase maturation protease
MILVIGYGNPLCGDDGIGPYAVERLADEESPADTEYLALRQLTPELAEPVSRADTVIFVDAADGGAPGNIICHKLTLSAEPSQTAPGAFTHHVNAAALLEIAHLLYGRHPVAYLFTVAGENFELGDSFSSGVESALPLLLDQLKAKIIQTT